MRDLLAAGHRQVADDARELAPDVADRLHARLHDAGLQLGGQQVQPLHGAQEGRVFLRGAELHDLVAGQDQFADQGHQLVEQADVHADGAIRDGRGARLGRLGDQGTPAARRRTWRSLSRTADGLRTASPFEAEARSGAATPTGDAGAARVRTQALQRLDHARIIAVAVGFGRFDGLQHLPHGVHHRQQCAGDLGVEDQLAVAQPAEQVLGGVGDGLQLLQSQEARRPLDGVQGAEHPAQRLALGGISFQRDQVEVELGQVLVRLDQEFANDFVHDSLNPAGR